MFIATNPALELVIHSDFESQEHYLVPAHTGTQQVAHLRHLLESNQYWQVVQDYLEEQKIDLDIWYAPEDSDHQSLMMRVQHLRQWPRSRRPQLKRRPQLSAQSALKGPIRIEGANPH